MPDSNPTAPANAPVERDSVIFIPAIDTTWTDQSIELISQKLVIALDRNAKRPKAKFRSEVNCFSDLVRNVFKGDSMLG
jgi:hypothetical protein